MQYLLSIIFHLLSEKDPVAFEAQGLFCLRFGNYFLFFLNTTTAAPKSTAAIPVNPAPAPVEGDVSVLAVVVVVVVVVVEVVLLEVVDEVEALEEELEELLEPEESVFELLSEEAA